MAEILIRGVSDDVVEWVDNSAAAIGLSRNEYPRQMLEDETRRPRRASVSETDWDRSAEVFVDLVDATIMDAAWR